MEYARRHGLADPVRVRAISTVTPTFPNTVIDMPLLSTDPATAVDPGALTFKESIGAAAYEEAGVDPATSAWPRSTTCRPPWSWTGSRTSRCASGARPSTCCGPVTPSIGGRIPVNPSGGLACFGEAVPAQALAQVCEVTWQLRGQAEGRQVENAKVGITANQGLFGHGSSVILSV